MRAIAIINAPWGIGLGARHITVSTSGLAPQIRMLAEQPLQIRLAISLHGATDEVREQIMPVNRKYPLAVAPGSVRLLPGAEKAADQLRVHPHRRPERHARAGRAPSPATPAGFGRKVNLIPYNTVEGLAWERPGRGGRRRFCAS